MAFTTPNMALRVWDQSSDPYDHIQLADNFSKVELHDHSTGKGVQIPTGGLADGAVTAQKIATDAIPNFSIADNSITTAKYQNDSVTVDKLAPNSVPATHVTHNAHQSFSAKNVFNTIAFNTENYDTHNNHSTVTNNSRLTCSVAGVYLIECNVHTSKFDGDFPKQMRLLKNGNLDVGHLSGAAARSWLGQSYGVSAMVKLAVGDWVEAQMASQYYGFWILYTSSGLGEISQEYVMPPRFSWTLIAKG